MPPNANIPITTYNTRLISSILPELLEPTQDKSTEESWYYAVISFPSLSYNRISSIEKSNAAKLL
jgi:hypothetical protein